MVSGPLRKIESDVRTGAMNYPQATLEMMDAMLTFSGITSPVMVISFAPPYYPAFHSDRLGETDRAGRTGGIQAGGIQAGEGTCLYNLLQKAAEDTCGLCLGKRNYCCGISDLSYCGGPDREEMASYAVNAPSVGNHVPDGPGSHGGFQGSLPFIRPHRQGCAPDVGAGSRQESAGRSSSNFWQHSSNKCLQHIGDVECDRGRQRCVYTLQKEHFTRRLR